MQIVHQFIAAFVIQQAGLQRTEASTGAGTLIQRFGSAANLNIHLHCLVLDGVYRRSGSRARAPASGGLHLPHRARASGGPESTELANRSYTRSTGYPRALSQRAGLEPSCRGVLHRPSEEETRTLVPLHHPPRHRNEGLALNWAGQVVLTLKTPYRDGTTRWNSCNDSPRWFPVRDSLHGVLAPNARKAEANFWRSAAWLLTGANHGADRLVNGPTDCYVLDWDGDGVTDGAAAS